MVKFIYQERKLIFGVCVALYGLFLAWNGLKLTSDLESGEFLNISKEGLLGILFITLGVSLLTEKYKNAVQKKRNKIREQN